MDTELLPMSTSNLASSVITDDLARANLLIASLKDRIRQQVNDRLFIVIETK
jgi:hypothetical protein